MGNCFDLLDPGNVAVLRAYLEQMLADMAANTIKPPVNVRTHRKLDCALFNHVYNDLEESQRPLDTARGVYVPTSGLKRICKGSWISEETHIQVCVRNPKSILAVWHVREDGRYGKAIP